MSPSKTPENLVHLLDNPDAREDVLVVDFDTLAAIEGVLSNVNRWGCCLTSDHVGDLYKNIGIKLASSRSLTKALVTSVKGNEAAVVFSTAETSFSDKRREKRNDVKISAKITDLEGLTELSVVIVDAANNGCKIKGEGLTSLPDEILLAMSKFEKPVVAEFAWRNDTSAGLRLLWDRTLEETEKQGAA